MHSSTKTCKRRGVADTAATWKEGKGSRCSIRQVVMDCATVIIVRQTASAICVRRAKRAVGRERKNETEIRKCV